MLFSPGDVEPVYLRECRDFRRNTDKKNLPQAVWAVLSTSHHKKVMLRDEDVAFVFEHAPSVPMREVISSMRLQFFTGVLKTGKYKETYELTVRFDVNNKMREAGVRGVANLRIERRRASWWSRLREQAVITEADYDVY